MILVLRIRDQNSAARLDRNNDFAPAPSVGADGIARLTAAYCLTRHAICLEPLGIIDRSDRARFWL